MKKFFENTRKPQKSLGGRIILNLMNWGHNKMSLWGLSHIEIAGNAVALDVGCGGGKNMYNLLNRIRNGKVFGLDYSRASVEKASRLNKKAIGKGKAEVIEGNISALPFDDRQFDIVTAFETVYFWPDIINDFKEVRRVLKDKGRLLICNEMHDPVKSERWIKLLNLNVYTKEELSSALSEAGFSSVESYGHENGRWLCVVAQKQETI
jgi:Methylase involved in ubiquinone/menaquinone biosynthesis